VADVAAQIDEFLKKQSSPLAGLGNVFAAAGQKYGVDPRLVVAISGAESSFGKHLFGANNGWGWGPGREFGSFQEDRAVTKGLRSRYRPGPEDPGCDLEEVGAGRSRQRSARPQPELDGQRLPLLRAARRRPRLERGHEGARLGLVPERAPESQGARPLRPDADHRQRRRLESAAQRPPSRRRDDRARRTAA
jgi:hypothetical protein